MKWLVNRLLPEGAEGAERETRRRCGVTAGAVGVGVNLLLSAVKLAAGLAAGAVSVVADGMNNLSDAATSVVTLVGFRLAGRQADADHPFGHGRAEYLAGLAVSVFILVVGVELAKESIGLILSPNDTALDWITAVVLLLSIAAKLWLASFNGGLGKRMGSATLEAAAADARSDVLATGAVLLGLGISKVTPLPLDGWVGLLVAALVLRAGWLSARATLDPLLGQPPDPEMVAEIEGVIRSYWGVLGIHDLVLHDYGPSRRMMSVHVEVPADGSLLEVHELIDHIEREVRQLFGIETVIHMDPVRTGDPQSDALRDKALALARSIHPAITIHDFRVTSQKGGAVVSFDAVAPYELALSDGEVAQRLSHLLREEDQRLTLHITVDRCQVL